MKKFNLIFFLKYISVLICLLIIFHPEESKAQFAYGADVSWLSQMEASGKIFKDNKGTPKDCLQILKEKGINALRFRVWVNPAEGYCNKKDVTYMCGRAKILGFNVMIDFHFSDTWADPGHQAKPAAWTNHSFSQLQTDVYDHVHGVLDTLKSIGVTPKWVQIGNETNNGMLWEDGKASTNMSNFAALIKGGYNAVKSVDTTIQVIVHLSDGHNDAMYKWMFEGLSYNGVKWDIIGMSVYPSYWSADSWTDYNSLVLTTMQDMVVRYHTKVMVVETGYPNNQPEAAKNSLIDLFAKTKSAGGLGVFYWEPECYNWQGYGLGAWDPSNQEPTAALDAFLTASAVVTQENTIPTDYDIKIYPNPFNPSTTIQFSILKAGNISLHIYDSLGRLVKSLVSEYKGAGKYSVKWDGLDDNGRQCSSGVYFVNMQTDSHLEARKMILLR